MPKRLMEVDGRLVYWPFAIPRKQKPVYRVSEAVRRLSRDRWLSPRECSDLGFRFARMAGSCRPAQTRDAAIPMPCRWTVGMLRGRPPALPDDPGYVVLMDWLQRHQDGKVKKWPPELTILMFETKQLSWRNIYGR